MATDKASYVHLSRFGYYLDFVLYPALTAALTAYALFVAWPHGVAFCTAAVAGLVVWTLVEYVFHRFVFHEWPVFRDMHDVHHDDPVAPVGTPSWVSLPSLLLFVFLPMWSVANTVVACGTSVGIIVGYYWYIVVHHGTHRWTPKPGTYFYDMWRHHARHHYDKRPGNFGVTTALWDRVFGTVLGRPR